MMRSGARSASGGGGDEAPRVPPYCIECRFMLQCAFLFGGNSSDTVRKGLKTGHLTRPDERGKRLWKAGEGAAGVFFLPCFV